MISLTELKRLLDNIVQDGKISETKMKDGKALARVILDDDEEEKRVTAFLPVLSLANSFGRVFFPLKVDEQVLVIRPFGSTKRGFIIRSIFNRGCKEPDGSNEHTAIVEFEDGTRISYDSFGHELKLENVNAQINIICKEANITADKTTINSTTTHVGDITVDGKLTVAKQIIGSGGIAVSGGTGAEFNGNIKAKDISAGNINASGEITDSQGNLTNHSNGGQGRD